MAKKNEVLKNKEEFHVELKGLIEKKGVKKSWLHKEAGMSNVDFYYKLRLGGFTLIEQKKILKLLK